MLKMVLVFMMISPAAAFAGGRKTLDHLKLWDTRPAALKTTKLSPNSRVKAPWDARNEENNLTGKTYYYQENGIQAKAQNWRYQLSRSQVGYNTK